MAASLLSFLLLYKYWALLLIFFFSGLILPLPTSTVLLAAGAFSGQGYFSFLISLGVIIASNVLGDCTGYFLARRYGRRALTMLHIRTPASIERLELFVRRHPWPAIFLTRFTGTTDVVVNLLAGFAGMPFGAFLTFDLFGNAVSNGILLYAGYFLGIHWQDFTGFFNIGDYILIGVVAIVILATFMWHRKRRTVK